MHFWTVSRHFQRSAPASLLSSSVSLTRIPYFRCRELSGTTSKTTYLRLFLNWFPRILKFENVIFLSSSASLAIVMLSITLYDISGRFMRFLCDFWCWRFFMRFLVLAIFMRFLGLAIFCGDFWGLAIFWRFLSWRFFVGDFFVAIFCTCDFFDDILCWRFFSDFWLMLCDTETHYRNIYDRLGEKGSKGRWRRNYFIRLAK